jgi:hypothetical protein
MLERFNKAQSASSISAQQTEIKNFSFYLKTAAQYGSHRGPQISAQEHNLSPLIIFLSPIARENKEVPFLGALPSPSVCSKSLLCEANNEKNAPKCQPRFRFAVFTTCVAHRRRMRAPHTTFDCGNN